MKGTRKHIEELEKKYREMAENASPLEAIAYWGLARECGRELTRRWERSYKRRKFLNS